MTVSLKAGAAPKPGKHAGATSSADIARQATRLPSALPSLNQVNRELFACIRTRRPRFNISCLVKGSLRSPVRIIWSGQAAPSSFLVVLSMVFGMLEPESYDYFTCSQPDPLLRSSTNSRCPELGRALPIIRELLNIRYLSPKPTGQADLEQHI